MSITHDEAFRMLRAAVAKADELGVKVGITILDAAGDQVASMRMEGVEHQWLLEDARGKCLATIVWKGEPSANLQERAGGPLLTWLNTNYQGKLLYLKGSWPIRRGDTLLGAIAAGGAPSQDDEDIARAGAAALDG